jgi:hypothetical protein
MARGVGANRRSERYQARLPQSPTCSHQLYTGDPNTSPHARPRALPRSKQAGFTPPPPRQTYPQGSQVPLRHEPCPPPAPRCAAGKRSIPEASPPPPHSLQSSPKTCTQRVIVGGGGPWVASTHNHAPMAAPAWACRASGSGSKGKGKGKGKGGDGAHTRALRMTARSCSQTSRKQVSRRAHWPRRKPVLGAAARRCWAGQT